MSPGATHPKVASIRGLTLACGLVLVLLAPNVSALFVVNQPWARPAKSGQSTEVYMSLTSTDGASLVAARTDDAAAIVIRGPGNGARTIPQLQLPAGTLVALKPGSNRLVIIELKRSVKPGDRLALTLTIEGADGTRQDIPVLAEVRMRSPLDDERRAHHAHPH
jgi:copper(I)-binding protein